MDRDDRDAAGGNAVYASARVPMHENHGSYPPARPQHHFYYASAAKPLRLVPDAVGWVGVLGDDSETDQIGELVEHPETGELRVQICGLDIGATAGRTHPITDRVVWFDHMSYKRELVERSVLTVAAFGIHQYHPSAPAEVHVRMFYKTQ